MTRSARRTSSLGSDSPEFVDGMSSRGHILDPEIQREIWQRSPFALPSDDKRVVYRKTVAGLFSMAHYYDHFADHPNFLRILADDMNWRHATVTFLIKRFVWSRIDYLRTAPTSNFIPNNASAECRNLCELVDKYRSIARNMRRYTITANRSQYINATRDIWKQQLLRDPQILLVQRPPLPHKPRVDWVQSSGGVHGAPFNGNRERSPSPLSQTSNPGHGYRMRSPEQRPRRHCSLSPQAHIKQRDEDAAQYYTGIGDFASNANANTEPKPHHDHTNLSGSARQSTPVDQGFAALALGQAWTIPDVVTAALDRVRECGTVEVSHVAKAQITSVVKLLEATQAVALDSDELSGLRFTRD